VAEHDQKHIVFRIEVPAIYTDDIETLKADLGLEGMTDSEFILNTIGEPGVVLLTARVSGEKDSDVMTVYGSILEAELCDPTTTDEKLRGSDDLEAEPDQVLRRAIEGMQIAGTPDEEILDELRYRAKRLRWHMERGTE
jgi:hypothetical protein